MNNDNIRQLDSKVNEYCACYSIRPRFELSDLYNIQTLYDETQSWPHHLHAGCYVLYSTDRKLLYVGKAVKLGRRLSNHFRLDEMRNAVTPPWERWSSAPRLVQAIKVNKFYEASSLEEFLIHELDPPDNSLGRKSGNDVAIEQPMTLNIDCPAHPRTGMR